MLVIILVLAIINVSLSVYFTATTAGVETRGGAHWATGARFGATRR